MKKIILTVLCSMVLLICAACGNTSTELNADEAVNQLLAAEIFDEELGNVKESVSKKRLSITDLLLEECISYAGTKAVVDEFAIVRADSSETAEKVTEAFEGYIESQKEVYSDYNKHEMPKLEEAYITTVGNYAVMVVSKDSAKAQSIIEDCSK